MASVAGWAVEPQPSICSETLVRLALLHLWFIGLVYEAQRYRRVCRLILHCILRAASHPASPAQRFRHARDLGRLLYAAPTSRPPLATTLALLVATRRLIQDTIHILSAPRTRSDTSTHKQSTPNRPTQLPPTSLPFASTLATASPQLPPHHIPKTTTHSTPSHNTRLMTGSMPEMWTTHGKTSGRKGGSG